MICVKISRNFISLKNLPYLTDFSPQLMACTLYAFSLLYVSTYISQTYIVSE